MQKVEELIQAIYVLKICKDFNFCEYEIGEYQEVRN